MKKAIMMFAALILIAAPALGDYSGGRIYWDRVSGYYSGNGGEFTIRSDGAPGLLLSNAAYDAKARGLVSSESFQTFCVETGEYVAQPMDIVVSTTNINGSAGSHAVWGGVPNVGDNLDARTAFLYTKFATGTLSGYTWTGAGRAASADALQKAIWYIEGESGGADNAFAALATDATTVGGNTDEWVGKGIGDVRILNMYTTSGGLAQDQLYLVPAPAAIGLGLIGLGLVGWLKRRMA
jgi:hypothetical protein